MPNSTDGFMAELDRMPRAWRDLINEFGWIIVREMRLDGHRDAVALREELIAWRERRQEAWLAKIPYPPLGSRRMTVGAGDSIA
jgi:hypothetical protein